MELKDIISDAFQYPLSDYKKFLILGLPFLVLGIVTLILGFQIVQIYEMGYEAMTASSSGFLVTSIILFYIIIFAVMLIMSGISLSVIRETINQSNILPTIDLKNNLIDGLKTFLVVLVYIGIPTLVLTFILVGLISLNSPGFIVAIFAIVIFIVIVLLGIFVSVAICRLAETNLIGESFNFSYIIEISKRIGIGKIFLTILVCNILLAIISLVGSLLELIPVIGLLIEVYILSTYSTLVTARAFGLLYRERNYESSYNNMYQQPVNNVNYNHQYNESPEVIQKGSVTDFNTTKNNQYDFHPETENSVNNIEESVKEEVKICSKCGYSNPDFVNICVNCGNKL